jgi:hypothetical protein
LVERLADETAVPTVGTMAGLMAASMVDQKAAMKAGR